METVTRNGTDYKIATQEEADLAGLDYDYWQEAEEGELAVTDDGYVCKVLSRNTYENRNGQVNSQVTLPFGRAWCNPGSELNYETYEEERKRHWAEKEAGTTRFKQVKAYIVACLASKKEIDWDHAGELYRPDQKRPDLTVRRLFRNKRISKMVQEDLTEILSDHGITPQKIAEYYQLTLEIAQRKEDLSNMNRALESLTSLLGMKPDKNVVEQTEEADYREFLPSGKKSKQLSAKRTTRQELPEGEVMDE